MQQGTMDIDMHHVHNLAEKGIVVSGARKYRPLHSKKCPPKLQLHHDRKDQVTDGSLHFGDGDCSLLSLGFDLCWQSQ